MTGPGGLGDLVFKMSQDPALESEAIRACGDFIRKRLRRQSLTQLILRYLPEEREAPGDCEDY